MAIYLVIFVSLLFFSNFKKANRFIISLVFISLVLLAGLRGEDVGVDTNTYSRIFYELLYNGDYPIEPGWKFINVLIGRISPLFPLLLSVSSFLTLLPVFYVSKKVSPYFFLSIFLYFSLHIYLGSFNIMRQYLAVSFILASYYFFENKSRYKYFLCLLIATSIHYSSIFSIVIFYFRKRVLTRKRVLYYLFVSLLIGSIANSEIISMFSFLNKDSIASSRSNLLLSFVNIALFDIFMLLFINKSKFQLLNTMWGHLFVLSLIVLNATYTMDFSARFYVIFSISQIIYLPLLIASHSGVQKRKVVLLVIFYAFIQFFRMLLANANNIVPYSTYF